MLLKPMIGKHLIMVIPVVRCLYDVGQVVVDYVKDIIFGMRLCSKRCGKRGHG